MELEVRNHNRKKKYTTVTGFVSFLLALLSLLILNIGLLVGDGSFIFLQLSILGLGLGIIGLFTVKSSRFYAFWGIGLNLFIILFPFLMFFLAWGINPKP